MAAELAKMAENSNQENGENVESLSPSRPISEKSKQMSDESEGSEQSDTLNRNIAEESKPENLPESEVENETSTRMEPDTEVTLSVETPPDITWSPIQTRNRRKTLKNYLECDTGEITTLEIENKNQNNTEHQTLESIINSSKAIKKKRLDTNRDKFKGLMKTGGNLVIEFSTATFKMVRAGIKNIMDTLKRKSTITVEHKQKTDKENNIVDEFYRVNRRVKGYGFTINLFRTTSRMMVNGGGMKDFMDHILPAISASVNGRKEELDKLDIELEKALKHTSTMTEAEQSRNTDNPIRLGTDQANTEVHTTECAIQVTSSKIVEITHKKQTPSGQTNSIKSLQEKPKQQGSKMTSSKNSEDNAQDSDHSEQNTACQLNENIYDKKEKQQICEVCPTCTKTVRTGVQCGICKHWFHYKCEKVTKEEVELKYPEEQ